MLKKLFKLINLEGCNIIKNESRARTDLGCDLTRLYCSKPIERE